MYSKTEQLKTNRLKKKRCKNCKKLTRTIRDSCEACTKIQTENPQKSYTKIRIKNSQKFCTKMQTRNRGKIPTKTQTKTSTKIPIRNKAKTARYFCHKYIRKRDESKPCISCGKYSYNKQAGHYKPDGQNSLLRYNEYNIHGQCIECNINKSGNTALYKANLELIYPIPIQEDLEAPKVPYFYTEDMLDLIISHYKYLYDKLQ